ncbi:DDE superfamily endonuclease [Abditibacterium utsteinense]|uniref:DDE superfamily endonuclease n=1 Tax=Abditibacterium utsteinense TaxID=1960156 RepID=A0A2S8SQ45_9BACT|nr:DDE superfamily endonuclease [Abditibacterium utsteinense]
MVVARGEVVIAWFEQQLCPVFRAGASGGTSGYLGQRFVSPMSELRALVEKVGCFLLPLPRYSPDLNKIEHFWPQIENRLDSNICPAFRFKVDAAFLPLSLEA